MRLEDGKRPGKKPPSGPLVIGTFTEVGSGVPAQVGNASRSESLTLVLLPSLSKRWLPHVSQVGAYAFLPDTHPRARNVPREAHAQPLRPPGSPAGRAEKVGHWRWLVPAPPVPGFSAGQRSPGDPRGAGGSKHLAPACGRSLATEGRKWARHSVTRPLPQPVAAVL